MAAPPALFDLRTHYASLECAGFSPLSQGDTCDACTAASLATILSILACISSPYLHQNITFSAQRLWDCNDGSCADGMHMDTLIDNILSGPRSFSMLYVSSQAKSSIEPSNFSRCHARSSFSSLEHSEMIAYLPCKPTLCNMVLSCSSHTIK